MTDVLIGMKFDMPGIAFVIFAIDFYITMAIIQVCIALKFKVLFWGGKLCYEKNEKGKFRVIVLGFLGTALYAFYARFIELQPYWCS